MAVQKKKIKILLVDDHPIVRLGLLTELKKSKKFQITGEASNGEEALSTALKTQPDVILLDINLPGENGITVLKILKEKLPATHVIALTMHDNVNYVHAMKRYGASGYILKDDPPDELISLIEEIIDNKKFLISSKILDALYRQSTIENLTQREREILLLISSGMKNKEIAGKLFLSSRTVEAHRDRIKKKLNLHTTADMVKYILDVSKC